LYGAAFIFIIGKRYKKQCSDTQHTYRHIPLWQFETYDEFTKSPIYDCQMVAVELHEQSTSLQGFDHPRRAVYLLGAEDNGLPLSVINKAVHIVQIPSAKPQSMNVATAGTLIMYDRFVKGFNND
jgi:tRNA G18 (ribose-2'-O)-methylase SpoU